jgi:hypothetical protein
MFAPSDPPANAAPLVTTKASSNWLTVAVSIVDRIAKLARPGSTITPPLTSWKMFDAGALVVL